jgi:hypothetical protein
MDDELGSRGIKGQAKFGRLLVNTAVASRAIHDVEAHTVDEVGIGGLQWALDAGRLVLHGIVEGARCYGSFERAGALVGGESHQAGIGVEQAATGEKDDADDDAKNKISHASSLLNCEWEKPASIGELAGGGKTNRERTDNGSSLRLQAAGGSAPDTKPVVMS